MQPVNNVKNNTYTPNLEPVIEEPSANELTFLISRPFSERMKLMVRAFANGDSMEHIRQISVSTQASVPTINFESIADRTPSPQSDARVTSPVSPTSAESDGRNSSTPH